MDSSVQQEANIIPNHAPSENWERFMLLWSVTPEVFIGSCIISVFAIIFVYFITRNDSYPTYNDEMDQSESTAEPQSTDDFFLKSNICNNRHRLNERTSRPKHGEKDAGDGDETGSLGFFESGGIETPITELSPYKKSLYRIAADKLEKSLTEQQKMEEREIQKQQLKAIFDLMKSKEDVFGIDSLTQMEEQLKFYG